MRSNKLEEATILALQGKLVEARNPENEEINTKIRKSLNGSTKYVDDLKNAGLDVITDENGKVVKINGMEKADLKNSHPDTDYFNHLTKSKEEPTETATGAFTPTNIFRDSSNFESTVGSNDNKYYNTDDNGVSKAIPKRYKTGNKNYDVDLDKFPRKSYNGVASYEPLNNTELNDFKYNKAKISPEGTLKRNLDATKAEYDNAKAEYDKVNDEVNDVRARIAKSKAKSDKKTEATKLEETDITPDFLNAIKELFNKYLRITPIKDITIETKEDISILNVIFENSNTIKINVTGDSNMAVIKDILNKID